MTRVLVVDDSETVRLYYRNVLEKNGAEVVEAVNGVEGMEHVLSLDFDLLLVDVNMAKMDGYQFVRSVRAEAAARAVPIVMISSEHEEEDRRAAYRAGANLYRVKPLKSEELVTLQRLLTGRAT